MPQTIVPSAGQTVGSIAGQLLNDPSRFREIADLNGIDVLDDLIEESIQVPLLRELQRVKPGLSRIRTGLDTTLSQAEEIVSRASGYTETARNAVGEVNGLFDSIDSTLENALTTLADVQGEATRTIDWLLDKAEVVQNALEDF